jgi:hypothetical protein
MSCIGNVFRLGDKHSAGIKRAVLQTNGFDFALMGLARGDMFVWLMSDEILLTGLGQGWATGVHSLER